MKSNYSNLRKRLLSVFDEKGFFFKSCLISSILILLGASASHAQSSNVKGGIEMASSGGILYFENQSNWSTSFNYLCIDDSCVSGEYNAISNRWERHVNVTANQNHNIQIKISTTNGGQFLSDIISVQVGEESARLDVEGVGGIESQNSTAIRQAESGVLLGSAKYYDDPSAINGKGVAYINSPGAGFKLENVPAASSLEILYTSEQSGSISVIVDGSDVGDISFSSNGVWVGNYIKATKNVSIPQGATVELQYKNGDSALNIDQVSFLSTTQVDPNPTCADGIQNQGETGIDCGGPNCSACNIATPIKNPVISMSVSPTAGVILTGGQDALKPGFSIYTFDNDNATLPFSNCDNGCASNWPPFTVANLNDLIITTQVSNAFTEEFGLSARCDGSLQVTYNNKPLYYYKDDVAIGDIRGDNIGGVWHIIKIAGELETCTDGIQNQDETGVDCGGSNCVACDATIPSVSLVSNGTCGDYGLTIVDGQGIIYSKETLGKALYMCDGPGFNGCVAPDKLEDGYYQRAVSVIIGEEYEFAIQGQPNTTFKVIAGDDRCYFVETCSDGVQNGTETGIDCGGSDCDICPTCTDGIQNGDEQGVDCGGTNCSISCEEVCNGTPNPNAQVTVKNESLENEKDGEFKFTFDDVSGRSALEFSLDSGNTYAYTTEDNKGMFVIDKLAPSSYTIFVRWSNNDCPINLGEFKILEGGPAPTCSDGILNQGEERVDCGGPNCEPCTGSPCGEFPQVNYPRPSLPTPIIGSEANQGFAFDLSEDLSTVSVRTGNVVDIQSGGNPSFEFHCSCNQVTFSSVKFNGAVAEVPKACRDAGDFYYFFTYLKQGNTTGDPGDRKVYSGLFTTNGPRIDPSKRPVLNKEGANWMRFRHPHAQDGITEAVFDAQHNSDLLRYMDRYNTIFTDGPDGLTIDPRLTSSNGNFHPHGGVSNATPVRIDYMEKGDSSPPTYAKSAGKDSGKWGYGNIVTYEITAVTGGSGAQTYNTFQNYVIGEGLNTLGDPRLSLAGRASTYMVLPGFGSHVEMEADAIFTQHIITLNSEDDVDDFLEGHHIFHGVRHRRNGDDSGKVLGEVNIGTKNCQECHFRDGRGSKLEKTKDGKFRVPPAVYGSGILQHIAGAEALLTWTGDVPDVDTQVRNALKVDHGIDPDTDMSAKDLKQLIAYTEFLTVPTRSPGSYDIPGVEEGDKSFNRIGCASCHSPTQKTTSTAPPEFRDLFIRPYTDMKMHNITGESYRTPALWGLGRNIDLLNRNDKALLFMHDGRATTLDGAIKSHGGEASGSRAAYNELSAQQQQNLVKFLMTL